MINIMGGKNLAEQIKTKLNIEVAKLNKHPKLIVIQIGDDKASSVYVRNKTKACAEVGIDFEDIHLSNDITKEYLINIINEYNKDNNINGIIIQQPVPKHLIGIEQYVSPEKDVDGFTHYNLGFLLNNNQKFVPCTTKGIIDLLEEYKISVEGKNVVIVGRSNIVGKPTAIELLNKNATVTICHSKTKNLSKICTQSDILIVAIGKPKFITSGYIGDNTNVIIDVGINRLSDGTLCGDTDFEGIIDKWKYLERHYLNCADKYITPVPRRNWIINSC